MQVIDAMQAQLASLAESLETKLGADVMSITGPIGHGLDTRVRDAAERFSTKRDGVAVVLQTTGGVVEVVERIVDVLRHHWNDVSFIVPDFAFSAGTVLAMSGDRIMMDYFSILGPIDPQVLRDNKFVPALSYLTQYQRIVDKFQRGEGTTADLALLNQLDLAELHQFEEAKRLSMELLVKWLAKYKFKDWTITETQKTPVTDEMKTKRAEEIAAALSNHELWHSHGRGISRSVLTGELNLKIDALEADQSAYDAVRSYHRFVSDMLQRENVAMFVHTRYYF